MPLLMAQDFFFTFEKFKNRLIPQPDWFNLDCIHKIMFRVKLIECNYSNCTIFIDLGWICLRIDQKPVWQSNEESIRIKTSCILDHNLMQTFHIRAHFYFILFITIVQLSIWIKFILSINWNFEVREIFNLIFMSYNINVVSKWEYNFKLC